MTTTLEIMQRAKNAAPLIAVADSETKNRALELMIVNKGKGINDLSARVAMCAINELLALKDKQEAIKILDDTINMHSEKEVQDTARSVKALMSFSS